MKNVYLAFTAMTMLVFASCNSKQGAYTEQEKDSLDIVDTTGREDKFKALEIPANDAATQVEQPVQEQPKAVSPSAEPTAEEKKMIK